ncbi:hypothetical protein PY650_36255, partial [Rhizobium calliandrae]
RKRRQTTHHRDLPTSIAVTRSGHAFEGRVLPVVKRLVSRGMPLLLVELPDGSRSHIPVAWTDIGDTGVSSSDATANHIAICRLADLQHLRFVADALLQRRDESPPAQGEGICN